MTTRYVVYWFDARGGSVGGSSDTLENALELARTAAAFDSLRWIVKYGRKIVARGTVQS